MEKMEKQSIWKQDIEKSKVGKIIYICGVIFFLAMAIFSLVDKSYLPAIGFIGFTSMSLGYAFLEDRNPRLNKKLQIVFAVIIIVSLALSMKDIK